MNIISYLGKGTVHQQRGKDCQDYLCYKHRDDTKNGNVVLALADGCSSSIFSKEAAQVATKIIVDIFSQFSVEDLFFNTEANSFKELKTGFLSQINKAIIARAMELGESPSSINEFLCTLLFVVIGQDNALVGHIGDGLIYIADKDLNPLFVSDAENGEDSSHTYFTFLNDISHFNLTVLPSKSIGHVFMSSDGPYKTLLACDNEDIGVPVKSIFAKSKQGEIYDRASLAKYTECMTLNILERSDDWSILLYNAEQEQCGDKFPEPVSMVTEMYWAYKADSQPELKDKLPVLTTEETPYEDLLALNIPSTKIEEPKEEPVQEEEQEATPEDDKEVDLATTKEQENEATTPDVLKAKKIKRNPFGIIVSILLIVAILAGAGYFVFQNKDKILEKFVPYQASYTSVNLKNEVVYDFSDTEYTVSQNGKTQKGELKKDDKYVTLTNFKGKSSHYCINGDYMYNRNSNFDESLASTETLVGQTLTTSIELNDGGRLTEYTVKQEILQNNEITISVTDKETQETIYQNVGTYSQNKSILQISYNNGDMGENLYTNEFCQNSTYLIIGNYVYSDIYKASNDK